jgi:hypothetical protein
MIALKRTKRWKLYTKNSMYSEELYQQYFEALAASCVDIGHAPGREHFFMNMETGTGLSELKAALKSRLRVPAMVLDECELDSDGSSGQKMTITGAFSILDKITPDDITTVREARRKSKIIARKIVNKMKRDSHMQFGESSSLLLAHAIHLGEIKQYPTPIILDSLAGWSVEFTWLVPDDITYGINDF